MRSYCPRRYFLLCFIVFWASFSVISRLINGIIDPRGSQRPIEFNSMSAKGDFKDNQDWLARRQKLITSASSRKVLLLSYMRGGSKLAGEIFNKDPDAVMWHEPLAAYYMARYGLSFANLPQHTLYDKNLKEINFSDEERDDMTSYLTQLLSCHLDKLPPHTWMHKFLFFTEAESIRTLRFCLQPKRQHAMVDVCKHLGQVCGHTSESRMKQCPLLQQLARQFVLNTNSLQGSPHRDQGVVHRISRELKRTLADRVLNITKFQIRAIIRHELCVEKMRRMNVHCMENGMRHCKAADVFVVKVNRMMMKDAEMLLLKNPDLHIIHYVRDPRAIAVSRIDRGLCIDRNNPDLFREMDLICRRMSDDIYHRKLLEARYPNATYVLRYEDLVLDPLKCANEVYRFINRRHENLSNWRAFFLNAIYGNKDHLTMRKNGKECITKWRHYLSPENITAITKLCEKVLQDLGYK